MERPLKRVCLSDGGVRKARHVVPAWASFYRSSPRGAVDIETLEAIVLGRVDWLLGDVAGGGSSGAGGGAPAAVRTSAPTQHTPHTPHTPTHHHPPPNNATDAVGHLSLRLALAADGDTAKWLVGTELKLLRASSPLLRWKPGLARGMMEEQACCVSQHASTSPPYLSSGLVTLNQLLTF
jgi:hypothetical protein